MARTDETRKLWGTGTDQPPVRRPASGQAIGAALLAVVQPDLFGGGAASEATERLLTLRRRRLRTRRRAEATALLSEPWSIAEAEALPGAVALARRYLRRHPERDRADPAPPFLTSRQAAAEWHAEEEMADPDFRRDSW